MDNAKSNLPALDAEEILAGVLNWVEIESPSHDGEAVNKMVNQVETEAQTMGRPHPGAGRLRRHPQVPHALGR